ncbi:MAG TPA: thermostable hemolysin [Pseudomonadales bacterium]
MMSSGQFNAIELTPTPAPSCRLDLLSTHHAGRPMLTRYIHQQFAEHYGADVHSFMPWLVGLYEDQRIAAAAGFRLASHEPLYLEQYLDEPIEAAMAHIPGLGASREHIAEIGNLAGTVRHCVRELFVALACLMQAADVEVITCTANPTVRALFREMKMPFKPLCAAVPARLGRAAHQWGSYYSRTCIIMACNIDDIIRAMAAHYPEILGRAVPAAQTLIAHEFIPAHDRIAH